MTATQTEMQNIKVNLGKQPGLKIMEEEKQEMPVPSPVNLQMKVHTIGFVSHRNA